MTEKPHEQVGNEIDPSFVRRDEIKFFHTYQVSQIVV